jgi:iron complex outermembrane receptor protein
VISKELMQEQMAVDYKSALRNVPGASVSMGGVNNGITYMTLRGFWVTSQIRNGMAALQSGGIDPVNVERVEVLKGPSGTLFGSSLISFGGFSNLVTKKPFDAVKGDITYTTGQWGLNRLTADVNTPLNEDHSLLMRVNAAVHTEQSFQSYGASRNFAVAPSFSYKVNDRLTLNLDAELYRVQRSTMPAYSFSNVTFKNIKDMPLGYYQSINSNDPLLTQGNMNIYVQAEYKLSSKWTSSTQFASASANFTNSNYLWPTAWINDSTIIRRFSAERGSVNRSVQFQQNFTGDFHIGSLRNRLVAGVEVHATNNHAQDYGTLLYDTINVRHAIRPMSLERINSLVATAGSPNQTVTKQYRYSAYVSDVVNLTDQVMVMLSLRADRFENKGTSANGQPVPAGATYGQTSLSPKLGVVYQPVKEKVAVFVNYMNGFQNQAPRTQPDRAILNLKPQYGNQVEVGTKLDIIRHKLSGTLSYYYIKLNNAVRDDPERQGFVVQDGTQVSKGFEADIIANPLPGLNIIAGYGYNNFEYTKANKNVQGTSNGLPQHMANGWVSYKFAGNALSGFGLGVGGNYMSEAYPNNEAGGITKPAYTRLDATVFYDQPRFRIGLKVNNLANERYWGLNNDAQPPRHINGSVSYKF